MSNMIIIELLTSGGKWIKVCDGSSHPSSVSRMLQAILNSVSWTTTARAVDSQTRRMVDMIQYQAAV